MSPRFPVYLLIFLMSKIEHTVTATNVHNLLTVEYLEKWKFQICFSSVYFQNPHSSETLVFITLIFCIYCLCVTVCGDMSLPQLFCGSQTTIKSIFPSHQEGFRIGIRWQVFGKLAPLFPGSFCCSFYFFLNLWIFEHLFPLLFFNLNPSMDSCEPPGRYFIGDQGNMESWG